MMERTTRTPSAADEPWFPLGRTFITPAAMAAIHPEDVADCLGRHSRGDWGECGWEDAAANDYAATRTLRLFSVYGDRAGTKFWIITEADRSATTVLLPDDY
ncbi:MAG: hypothetical protein AMXMBFR47_36330 [Planctomycetota bacterium]